MSVLENHHSFRKQLYYFLTPPALTLKEKTSTQTSFLVLFSFCVGWKLIQQNEGEMCLFVWQFKDLKKTQTNVKKVKLFIKTKQVFQMKWGRPRRGLESWTEHVDRTEQRKERGHVFNVEVKSLSCCWKKHEVCFSANCDWCEPVSFSASLFLSCVLEKNSCLPQKQTLTTWGEQNCTRAPWRAGSSAVRFWLHTHSCLLAPVGHAHNYWVKTLK